MCSFKVDPKCHVSKQTIYVREIRDYDSLLPNCDEEGAGILNKLSLRLRLVSEWIIASDVYYLHIVYRFSKCFAKYPVRLLNNRLKVGLSTIRVTK